MVLGFSTNRPSMDLLGTPLFDNDVLKLLARFAFNVFFLILIVKLAIRPTVDDRDFGFSVVMMNVAVFFICFALKKLELGLGMALGLFAIFGVLRYRAEAISNKEMTYLFIVIAIAVINALSNQKTSYVELVLINTIILSASLIKESTFLQFLFLSKRKKVTPISGNDVKSRSEKVKGKSGEKSSQDGNQANAGALANASQTDRFNSVGENNYSDTSDIDKKSGGKRKLSIIYDRLDLLAPVLADELLRDLQQRTNLPIQRIRVQDVDLTKQTATISVWLTDSDSE